MTYFWEQIEKEQISTKDYDECLKSQFKIEEQRLKNNVIGSSRKYYRLAILHLDVPMKYKYQGPRICNAIFFLFISLFLWICSKDFLYYLHWKFFKI